MLIAPSVPAGTSAAFATTTPLGSFRVDTMGCGCPVGHAVNQPSGPPGTTVTLSEYAAAVGGSAQVPVNSGKLREVMAGRKGPLRGPPAKRVSTRRHGVTV